MDILKFKESADMIFKDFLNSNISMAKKYIEFILLFLEMVFRKIYIYFGSVAVKLGEILDSYSFFVSTND